MHGPLREERKRLQNKMSDHRTRGPTLTRYQMAKTKEGLQQYEDIIIPDRRLASLEICRYRGPFSGEGGRGGVGSQKLRNGKRIKSPCV